MRAIAIAFILMMSFTSKADQLAYISKEQAEEAAEYLMKHTTVYLFCGCCSMQEPEKVKVIDAVAMHTGYENYYEVEIKFEGVNGEIRTHKIDLAYVWRKRLFGYKTIGAVFGLEHDFCVNPKNWNDSKNNETDI